jgi:hypothetical protein
VVPGEGRLPLLDLDGSVSSRDEDDRAGLPADAASPIALKETHAHSAVDADLVAVPARAGRHPLGRLQAHGAAAVVVDNVVAGCAMLDHVYGRDGYAIKSGCGRTTASTYADS